MEINKKLSIVIPTYNRADFLDYSLEIHIPMLKEYGIEIAIFDNASTDNTQEIVSKWMKEYDYLTYHKNETNILLYTVDKFQGMEADLVFLSMVRGKSIGFMDNINRLNVALTRAKYQRVIVGDKNFFTKQNGSQELKRLAEREGI